MLSGKRILGPPKPIKTYIDPEWFFYDPYNEILGSRVLFVADPYRTQKRLMHLVAMKKQMRFAKLGHLERFERFKVREAERERLLHQAQQRSQEGGTTKTLTQYLRERNYGRYKDDFSSQRLGRGTVPSIRMCVSTVKYAAHEDLHYMVSHQKLSII